VATFVRAGCHHECNLCTQVCPTGVIRPLNLEEKRVTKMALARVDTKACLPHRGVEECRVCADACDAAGYRAVEMRRVRLEIGAVPEGVFSAFELEEMSTILAPFVRADACVGCGQCENRCHAANVVRAGSLGASAVSVVAVAR
jgi:Pyruvate/2-oxoacid:ferredoxin oxidoreductase delta subunit